ncbi:MAG TPA: hypothetical protein G4N94_02040 [Caldilineae bacterium]|nr:hypothetical protein [Caldilineae bacterium]
MSYTAIFNCDLFTPDERIPQGLVLVEGSKIRAVGRSHEVALPATTRLLDARGGRITPGLIDLVGVTTGHDRAPARGITAHLIRVTLRTADDLAKISAVAAELMNPSVGSHVLGLHLVILWSQANGHLPHWQDVWIASDATVKLITLTATALASDTAAPPDGDVRLVVLDGLPDGCDARVAVWGIPDEARAESTHHHLATLDHLRSADPAVLRALISSRRLILTSGRRGPLNTRSIRRLMALADIDFASALGPATLAPATFLGSPLGRLAPAAPADLICWTRHGDLAWTMVGGEFVHPASPAAVQDSQHRPHNSGQKRQAIRAIQRFLQNRDDTLDLHLTEDETSGRGIDLRWRFRRKDGVEEMVSIQVQVDATVGDDNLSFATGRATANRPACSLDRTQADWCFYYAPASQRLHCLPVRATRAWLQNRSADAEDAILEVSLAELQAAVPRLRTLRLA